MKSAVVFSMFVGSAAIGLAGCASAPLQPMTLSSIEHGSYGARSLALTPLRVKDCSLRGSPEGIRLYLGALFTSLEAGNRPFSRVSLVIQAARDSMEPMLARNRQMVLELDGEMFVVGQGDPALYNYRALGGGYIETVIIPINLSLLQRLSTADRVRGRIGSRINFALSDDFGDGFATFLNAVRRETALDKASAVTRITFPDS